MNGPTGQTLDAENRQFQRGTAESEQLGQPASSSSYHTAQEFRRLRVPARRLRRPGVSHALSSCCGMLRCGSSFVVDVSLSGAGRWKSRAYTYSYSYSDRELEFD